MGSTNVMAIAIFDGSVRNLILEDGNNMVFESGDNHIAETPNAAEGNISLLSTLIPFSGDIYVKNSGVWQKVTATTYVNVGGVWVQPLSGFVFENSIWKRVK